MRIEPGKRRSIPKRTASGQQLSIPSRLNIIVAIFLLAWFGGWSVGGWSAGQNVWRSWQKGEIDWFLLFWLVGWIIGEVGVMAVLAYMAAGRELISLTPGVLSIRLEVFGLGRSWEYGATQIRNLRVAPAASGRQQWSGHIAFDYGASTVRFARDVDEAEAASIVSDLKSSGLLPQASA